MFTAAAGSNATYGANGAEIVINAKGQAPTFTSTKYMFFGTVDVTMRVAKGAGIVTTIVLESDVLDEIDWEWLGGANGEVQSNYFSKGNTATYGQLEQRIAIPGGDDIDTFHTYSLDWTPEKLEWKVDGTSMRTLTYAGNENTYPQTPMMVKFGTWCAGCSDAPGTVAWAGGAPDFSQAPFTAYYKSISIKDNANGVANAATYQYTDQTGSKDSIKINTGSGAGAKSAASPPTNAATGAQSTPTTLSKATGTAGQTTATPTGESPIGQAVGPAANAELTGAANGTATATATATGGANKTGSGSAAQTTSPVQAGAQKGAVNFALLGAAMFAFFTL